MLPEIVVEDLSALGGTSPEIEKPASPPLVQRWTSRRSANRCHQQSLAGRLDHRDRQQAYRCRRRQQPAGVTDQSSLKDPMQSERNGPISSKMVPKSAILDPQRASER